VNRRGFLGALAGLVGAAALDPERALWVPGAKVISIPPAVEPWTVVIEPGNALITPTEFARESLLALKAHLELCRAMSEEMDAQFSAELAFVRGDRWVSRPRRPLFGGARRRASGRALAA
jgi:hypothetical protein